MVSYIITDKGYCYKQYKNGKKTRVSYNEYKAKNNKSLKTSGGSNTTNNILPEDVLYKDDLVCILKPDVKKGIVVFSSYKQPANSNSLCKLGLKTGKKLKEEGVDFGRGVYHPYIFFRAPYNSPDTIDYSSIETEAEALYEKGVLQKQNKAWIRVDPNKTYVFSSEIRAKQLGVDETTLNAELERSKKTLTEYLEVITSNQKIVLTPPNNSFMYNLYSSVKVPYFDKDKTFIGGTNGKINWNSPAIDKQTINSRQSNGKINWSSSAIEAGFTLNSLIPQTKSLFAYDTTKPTLRPLVVYPFDKEPIETNSEILVSIEHLTSEYLVYCT